MPVDKSVPTHPPTGRSNQYEKTNDVKEPLSGSKSIKNKNHSRKNNGEG